MTSATNNVHISQFSVTRAAFQFDSTDVMLSYHEQLANAIGRNPVTWSATKSTAKLVTPLNVTKDFSDI